MKKYTTGDSALAAMTIGFLFFVIFGILTPCFLKVDVCIYGPIMLWHLFGALAALFLLCYLVTLIVVVAKKRNVAEYLELSAEISVIVVLFTALSPIVLVLSIIHLFGNLSQRKLEKY